MAIALLDHPWKAVIILMIYTIIHPITKNVIISLSNKEHVDKFIKLYGGDILTFQYNKSIKLLCSI
jgi:hypothetical protein